MFTDTFAMWLETDSELGKIAGFRKTIPVEEVEHYRAVSRNCVCSLYKLCEEYRKALHDIKSVIDKEIKEEA